MIAAQNALGGDGAAIAAAGAEVLAGTGTAIEALEIIEIETMAGPETTETETMEAPAALVVEDMVEVRALSFCGCKRLCAIAAGVTRIQQTAQAFEYSLSHSCLLLPGESQWRWPFKCISRVLYSSKLSPLHAGSQGVASRCTS